jgi:Winged helix-turn-helix DNA-binding
MPPETTSTPDTLQTLPEPSSPTHEASAPEPALSAPESSSAPAEASPALETAQAQTPTAHILQNEPIAPESEPFDSAQDKPTPELPSAVASTPTSAHPIRDLLVKARVAIQDRKRKKRDKIMQELATKSKITNDEVEKLLHVSDATATRYLSALEKEGKIKQVGKTGHGVVYSKT